MFRALLAHPQEALNKRHLVHCVRVMLAGCYQDWSGPDITGTQYTTCRLCSTSWGWASNARNMYRPLILNKLNRKCITLLSLYTCTMMNGQQNIKFNNTQYVQTNRNQYANVIREGILSYISRVSVPKLTHVFGELRTPNFVLRTVHVRLKMHSMALIYGHVS
jgi:hypothetical protein